MNNTNFYPNLKKICFWLLLLTFSNLAGQSDTIKPYDILINEFMPDPSPSVGLPNSEYIELYNRSAKNIELKGFKLINGSVETILPAFYLKSKNFVTIYTLKSNIRFGIYGDTLPVSKLISLNNPNDTFFLEAPNGNTIDAVYYDLSFYQDAKKASGGWSLERVDVNDFCSFQNWAASTDSLGGTPSKLNSVQKINTVQLPFETLSLTIKNKNNILVYFNKKLDIAEAMKKSHFEWIDKSNQLTINKITMANSLLNSVLINLNADMKAASRYNLVVKNTIKDCQNTPLSKNGNFVVQLPEKPMKDSLIINEILFDPEAGGARFIELYNRSKTKVFDIGDLTIGEPSASKSGSVSYLLFPEKYVVLTPNPSYIKTRYRVDTMNAKAILKNSLPTWANDKGTVLIKTGSTIIDSFSYTKAFHNPLLAHTEGVSLERIFIEKPTNDASNWQSAAVSVGYATPAYQNSQYYPPSVKKAENPVLSFETPQFSPDGDGFQDVFLIKYKLEKEGYIANFYIYDLNGKLVKTLKTNELLALEGQYKWEGDNDEGIAASSGVYIFYAELISPAGGARKWKKAFTLTNQ